MKLLAICSKSSTWAESPFFLNKKKEKENALGAIGTWPVKNEEGVSPNERPALLEYPSVETITYTPQIIIGDVQVAIVDLWREYGIPKVLWGLSVNHCEE